MLNFEKEKQIDVKSLIRKFKPLIIFTILFIIFWLIFTNFYLNKDMSNSNYGFSSGQSDHDFEELINTINSDSFNNLVFTPNSRIFDEVKIEEIDVFVFNNNPNPFGN
ncbi:MAG: hypothetical protein PHI91_01515 [Candidatus Pacebacteria bacterium]|jgi:hypothetical protein|nr:hypothetical protein [Candidatus Paceibacterota bacterium]MDD3283751.1 hypothetical protein [Candidatus Paceibacterota bacterium]MDD3969859.1 hypothetical protein [Candidatus Paceibacterota bacterium]MDD4738013.1 hypothetical protein [Candidatus Paceibacterota bacterium]